MGDYSMETSLILQKWTLTLLLLMMFVSDVGVNCFSWNTIACHLHECCSQPYINLNMTRLIQELTKKVYGQHLVLDIIKSHLEAHFDDEQIPPKPLVLSFHGGTGTGKNHVTRIIVDSIYVNSFQSKFVHYYHVSKKFPHMHKLEEYSSVLQTEIENGVYKCERSLFVFDEFDHMPEGLIDRIKFYLDFHENVEGIDYRKSMFIFLTNSGEELINEHVIAHHQQNKKRDDIKLSELEHQISGKAQTVKGGFYGSELIGRYLVTAYVPFLPLMKQHVVKCIENELNKRHHKSLSENLVQHVLEQLQFVDKVSVSGCKRVSEKVAYALIKFRHEEL